MATDALLPIPSIVLPTPLRVRVASCKPCWNAAESRPRKTRRSPTTVDIHNLLPASGRFEGIDKVAKKEPTIGSKVLGFAAVAFVTLVAISALTGGDESSTAPDSNESDEISRTVQTASRICSMIDAAGAATQPCSYSGWSATIDVVVNATPEDAMDFCLGVKEMLNGEDMYLMPGWRMNLRSPFSGENNIAMCRLS